MSILEVRRKEKAKRHEWIIITVKSPFEAKQIIFSGGGSTAAHRLKLTFTIPLSVILAPTDQRG